MKKFRPCGQDSECGFVIRSMLGATRAPRRLPGARGVSVVAASLGNDRAIVAPASSSASRSVVRCAHTRRADRRRLHDRRREPPSLPDQDVAATNVEQANPRRDTPPHRRRHRRTPYSSASERSTSHPRRMDQHTLSVPPLGSFAVSRPIASKPSRPAARRTHSHCRAGKGSKQRVGRADHVGSSATAPRRSRRSPGPNSTKLLQIEVQPQRVLECGESRHPDLADRFRIQTPNRHRTHLLRLRFRRSRQT